MDTAAALIEKIPHVKVPKKVDQILLIISEDLRNNKVFNKLEKIGFDTVNARSHFTFLVLDLIFGNSADDLAELYLRLLEKYTQKVNSSITRKSLAKRSFRMYIELMIEKRVRKQKRS